MLSLNGKLPNEGIPGEILLTLRCTTGLVMTNLSFLFQIWLQTSDLEHIFIAGSFFHYAGLFDPPECNDISPNPGRSDPLYIVKAKKKAA